MGEDETISAEEFDKWVTAPEAVRRRSRLEFNDKVRQIFEWLKLGHLRAAAHHATKDDESIDFLLIDKKVWVNTQTNDPTCTIWVHGRLRDLCAEGWRFIWLSGY